MTTLFVVGSAPCLFEDVAAASKIFPEHDIMLVNGACTAIEKAAHVLAGHTDKSEIFAKARRERFPDAPPWRLHANYVLTNATKHNYPRKEYPSVTDWWPGTYSTGATSAAKAARIGLTLGYAPIILCGCPLDGSGYAPQEAQIGHNGCARLGYSENQNLPIVESYKRKMAKLAEGEFKGKVFSMSGYTRRVLGSPEGA